MTLPADQITMATISAGLLLGKHDLLDLKEKLQAYRLTGNEIELVDEVIRLLQSVSEQLAAIAAQFGG